MGHPLTYDPCKYFRMHSQTRPSLLEINEHKWNYSVWTDSNAKSCIILST